MKKDQNYILSFPRNKLQIQKINIIFKFILNSILAAFTDCYDAAVFLIENSAKYGIKRDQIVVSGDSAGGQLSLSVGMHLTQNGFNIKGSQF